MSMTQRQRIEQAHQEAELSASWHEPNSEAGGGHELGFILGRTVGHEQIIQAATILAEVTGEPRPDRFERTIAKNMLQAAGFLIEGEDT